MNSIRFRLPQLLRATAIAFAAATLVHAQTPQSPACAISPSSTPDPARGIAGPPIRLNTIGFLPDSEKRATIASPEGSAFRVVRISRNPNAKAAASNAAETAFTGTTCAPFTSPATDTGETVRIADFSEVTTPGTYRIEADGLPPSAPFVIAPDIWDRPFDVVLRGFTLWRCGTAVRADYEGLTFAHAACHHDDGWLDYAEPEKSGPNHTKRDGTGGWHDAGDYNKYTVNAAMSVGIMLQASEHFFATLPPARRAALLDENRWELEWLLKMQRTDGRVYHKLSQLNFDYWGVPENDTAPRYFTGWSTVATADFAAVMALATRVYSKNNYDTSFATRCRSAALLAWQALAAHPQPLEPAQKNFATGTYTANDATHRLWAAAELWETTGDAAYLGYFEQHAKEPPVLAAFVAAGPSWADARCLAFGTYLRAKNSSARDSALVKKLRDNLLAETSCIITNASTNAYGRPFGTERKTWFWGANGSVAAQTYLLHLADFLQPDPRNRQAAQHALAFLFGRNFHARSYITGLGTNPPQHLHDRRGEPAWPGYLVGGGWPDGRSWVDETADFRQNEIAINWNASLVYALAPFVL